MSHKIGKPKFNLIFYGLLVLNDNACNHIMMNKDGDKSRRQNETVKTSRRRDLDIPLFSSATFLQLYVVGVLFCVYKRCKQAVD